MINPTVIEVVNHFLQGLAFVVLYIFIGFGPGFLIGILVVNFLRARHKPTFLEGHKEAARLAAQHNTQWDPSHDRWQN